MAREGAAMKNHQSMLSRAEDYLAYRRKLGFQLNEGRQILNFARYADSIGQRGPLTTDLALDWAGGMREGGFSGPK